MPLLDDEQPTEDTPLLSTSNAGTTSDALPAVNPVVAQLGADLRSTGSLALNVGDFPDWCPDTLPSDSQRTAFILVVLLNLLALRYNQATNHSGSVWEQWSTEKQDACDVTSLQREIVNVWNNFIGEFRTTGDIEDLLWSSFPLAEDGETCIRVVDFINQNYFPEEILIHRVLYLSLLNWWKNGPVNIDRKEILHEIVLQRLDALCTPRVMHLFDVLLRLVYLGAFLHFAILPPIPSTESTQPMAPQFREYLIVLYAASQLFRPWGLVNTPYILVFLAFLSCLPSVPFPQDYAYSVLLAALCLDILQLHFPIYPTPILLLPPNQALPLSVLIAHGTFKIFLPVILFFLPAILLASFLLSISLSDTFLRIFTLTTLEPSPLEARMAFLSLLTITFILLICSLAMLILVYPTLSSQGPQNSWDRYSKSIGLDARRRFASTVVTYSEPHFFPPPLHVIRVVFLAPSLVLSRLPRWKDWQPWLNGLEAVLWRILVLPGALVVAGFWGWGLSQ